MGTNQRYAHRYDEMTAQKLDALALAKDAARYPLQSLTPEELALDVEPMTRDPNGAEESLVWVRFGPRVHQVRATVWCWTAYAVGVEFLADGKPLKAWVWRSAVRPLDSASRAVRPPQ